MLGQLHGHGPGQLDHAGLGRVVADEVLHSTEAVDGCGGDDPSPALLDHLARGGLAAQEDARQIDPQHAMPLGLGMLEEGSGMRDPRVGEHHVEPPELRDHTLDEGLHLPGVADIDADGDGLAASLADLLGHGLGGVELDVAEGHEGALRREGEPRRAPDAQRAPCDGRHASLQAHTPTFLPDQG